MKKDKYKYMSKLPEVKIKIVNDKQELVLDKIEDADLPNVSILTITKDRKLFFQMAINNWEDFDYPKEKLEWIILDDSVIDNIKDMLPNDLRIKYIKCDKIFTDIAEKRNLGVGKCNNEFIVLMDDDDYHYPDSIRHKISTIIQYKKGCVFTDPIAIYNIINDTSQLMYLTKSKKNGLNEGTIAFRKSFWETQKFQIKDPGLGEGFEMVKGRYKFLMKIPFQFNCICMSHKQNITGDLRNFNQQKMSLYQFFDQKLKKEIYKIKNGQI